MKKTLKKIFYFTIIPMIVGCGTQNSGNESVPSVARIATNTWFVNSLEDIETYADGIPSNRHSLTLLKNEKESVQLVIATDSDTPLKIERLNATEGMDFECRRLEYFENMQDVLVPCNGVVTPKDNCVKVWLTFKSGTKAKEGKYTEVIRFKNDSSEYAVALSLNVVDAAIPEIPTLPSVFGIHPEKFLSEGLDNEQQIMQHKEVSDFLLNYRISPYFFDWLPGSLKIECSSSPYSWNDYRTWDYLKDPRFTRIAFPLHYLSDSELEAMTTKAKSENLLDKVYFYLWDEPSLTTEYDEIHEMAGRVHKYAPEAQVLITFFRGPKDVEGPDDEVKKKNIYTVFDHLDGTADIFCTGVWSLQGSEERAAGCREKLKDGQQWWCYVCMADTPGLANNSTGVPNRVVMWRLWKEQTSGFLYWTSNNFETMNPLTSPSDLPEGDGEMVYPGSVYDSDSPCASIRLERWLDGAEDYELLTMYEKKNGRKAAEALLSKVYTNSSVFTKDVEKINEFKQLLIEGII